MRVACGGGLYVRTLGHDLCRALGTLGHVAELRRSRVGRFGVAECLDLEEAQVVEKIATRHWILESRLKQGTPCRLRRCPVPKRRPGRRRAFLA